jgi:hypothetical protein
MRVLALVPFLAAALLTAGGAAADVPTLVGTVGPGFSIRLADLAGNRVLEVPPGTYTLRVNDLSPEHNFHLSGPGVDMATEVEGTGTVTWTVTLQEGTYHYECEPHFTTMKGDLQVVTGAPLPATSPPPPPPPPPPPKPVSLVATVGPGATVALKTLAGKKVVAVKARPVLIRLFDRSASDNFHLVGPGVNRTTTRLAKVAVVWKLTLKRGTYVYRSDGNAKLHGSFKAL